MVTLAFYAIIEQLASLDMQQINTYEVNIATSWMFSRIKKVNFELFFFPESRLDFRKFSPVKQVIKKVWPYGICYMLLFFSIFQSKWKYNFLFSCVT